MQALDPNLAKNVLILSYGPVPTPEFQKIEGGGMRCWGLATGLRDNGHNVTVSVFQEFKQNIASHGGINLHNWALDDDFKAFMNSFDAVIVSYSMGDPSVFVADNLSHHITLVLDCYVPIFIEISARDSADKAGELRGYLHEVPRFNHVLKRGDFFLCANEPQKHMYAGILGSLGVLNPYTYRQNRILVVPFGVEEDTDDATAKQLNPYKTSKNDFVLLWFGGLYPWFNFEPLIEAVEKLSKNPNFKFYLVGGKNPYNDHPDFVKQYEHVLQTFKKNALLNKTVFMVDWIDFKDRVQWYKNADIVISINSQGEENIYSWRTRVMDYIWGDLPMISNGGDPLSDELIANGAGVKTGLSSDEIVSIVSNFMQHPKQLATLRENLAKIKESYRWSKVTKVLSDQLVSDNNLPYVQGLHFIEEHGIEKPDTGSSSHKLRKVAGRAQSLAARAKQKGIMRSARFAASMVKAQAKAVLNTDKKNAKPKAVFLSHPIDHTGAPLVLIDVINDFGKTMPHKDIHLVAPAIERKLLNPLLASGYKIHKMADGIGGRIIQAGLQINPNDFVLMNTLALYSNYKNYLYWMLETGRLNKAHWFIHEDTPKNRFGDKREVAKIERLVNDNKLNIVVPSIQTAKEYNEFFNTNRIKPVTLRVDIAAKLKVERKASDFNTIRFFISGIPLDGRKGQLLFISALQLFEARYRAANPQNYREYTLDLVAIGKDYVSEQITTIGRSVMGKNLHIHPIVDRNTALDIANKCNVTVCSSLNETFALYVAEGMLMGHPILRNTTSGWQEQIVDGANGFKFDTLKIDELAAAIERILNKSLNGKELVRMSSESQKIASTFSKADYYQQILAKD